MGISLSALGRTLVLTATLLSLISLPFGNAIAELSKDEQNCINALNKRGRLLTKTIALDVNNCVKDFAKGKIGSADACAFSDPKDKVQKARDNTIKDWDKKCVGKGVAPPSIGPSDPNSIIAESETKESNIVTRLFGTLDGSIKTEATDKFESKCQQTILKDALKCQDFKLLEFLNCKKFALKANKAPVLAGIMTAQELQDECLGTGTNGQPDAKQKIAKACNLPGAKPDKIRKDLDKKCVGKDVVLASAFGGGECAAAAGSIEDMANCIDAIVECEVCEYLNTIDNLSRDCDLFDNGTADGSCADVVVIPEECPTQLAFTTGLPGGNCGRINDAADGTGNDLDPFPVDPNGIGDLTLECSNLYIGGGSSAQPPSATPNNGTQITEVVGFSGGLCEIGPSNGTGPDDCTFQGCPFGPPLPIPNPDSPPVSTCVVNTLAQDMVGTVDPNTGEQIMTVVLDSAVFLTSSLIACPQCIANLCVGGDNNGGACTTTNTELTSNACPPSSTASLGSLLVNLSPLSNGDASSSAADGLFCPSQFVPGCFANGTCRYMETLGTNPGPLGGASTLSSTFCIAATGNGLVDATASLPGPGAITLKGSNVITP